MVSEDEKQQASDTSDHEQDSDVEDEKTGLFSSPDGSATTSRSPSPDPLEDSHFVEAKPSPLKRSMLLIFFGILLWLAFSMRSDLLGGKQKPKIVHASRYSKEHKFRPAASPVITETLKDGRVRLRGALQTPTATPTPTPKKKPSAGKMSGKRKTKKKVKRPAQQGKRM